ncbi:L-seryl-tRNA(Sec) selenium transferase [soil metagenome]
MPEWRPPSVDSIVRSLDDGTLPRPLVVEAVRHVIDEARQHPETDVTAAVQRRLDEIRRSLPRRVVNATGVILHTNLGRAPWSADAVTAVATVSAGYANIELDLQTGERGGRNAAAESLVTTLTGAEAALVVNNNASAVFLTLLALGQDGPVPVSRGELLEIGGSYRLPELMAAAGAQLAEVGTTNRTRVDDYAAVTNPALLLKVHPSNYRVVGFSSEATIQELADLADARGVPLVFDAGSGLRDDRTPWLARPPAWLAGEPGVRQALQAGADLVLFSGDKLIGGPQAGIIVGSAELVGRLRAHPATRALRVDGATTAALAATLSAYLSGRTDELPLWRMATTSTEDIRARSASVVADSGVPARLVDGFSTVGAGSAPGAEIATCLIEVDGADRVYSGLLASDPPVVGRRDSGSLLLDLRTVDPSDDHLVTAALRRLWE